MFGCNTKGYSEAGFRVSIECPRQDDLPDIEELRDPLSGEVKLFDSVDEAVLAAQEHLAELEAEGKNCIAHVTFYARIHKPVLVVWDSNARTSLPVKPCLGRHSTRVA